MAMRRLPFRIPSAEQFEQTVLAVEQRVELSICVKSAGIRLSVIKVVK